MPPGPHRTVYAQIKTARVMNINMQDWSVDVVTLIGEERMTDIQLMNPYLHYANGEGMYVMPEVGALCWVCMPSDGMNATAFILGFMAPPNQETGDFGAGRVQLNPGDMMMKTRDENFLILRRGGVLQLGSTPMAQRMYIPLRNLIQDFCENYKLNSVAGSMEWLVHRTNEDTSGDQHCEMKIGVREKAKDPRPIADLRIGSHGEGSSTTLTLDVRASGAEDAETQVSLVITKDGDVTWEMKRNFSMEVDGDYVLTVHGDHSVFVDGEYSTSVSGDAEIASSSRLLLQSANDARLRSDAVAHVDGAVQVQLGDSSPLTLSPAVRATELVACLNAILTLIASLQCPSALAAAAITASSGSSPLLSGMLSVTPVVGTQAAPGIQSSLVPPIQSAKVFLK